MAILSIKNGVVALLVLLSFSTVPLRTNGQMLPKDSSKVAKLIQNCSCYISVSDAVVGLVRLLVSCFVQVVLSWR